MRTPYSLKIGLLYFPRSTNERRVCTRSNTYASRTDLVFDLNQTPVQYQPMKIGLYMPRNDNHCTESEICLYYIGTVYF